MLFWQILVDGFAISSLYALGATGFALIFGVSGVLNLSHGALMVTAVVAACAAGNDLHAGAYAGAVLGVAVGFVATLFTYFLIVRPLQQTRKIREDEKEIFILTATLLWGIMRAGKAVLAASMNPRGVTLLGVELAHVYIAVWAIYGILVGVAGVLLGMFLGVSSYSVGPLTASAFSIVVLGGLGSVSGALIAAYVVGYLETITAYLISPAYRTIPALLLLVAVTYVSPRGLLRRR